MVSRCHLHRLLRMSIPLHMLRLLVEDPSRHKVDLEDSLLTRDRALEPVPTRSQSSADVILQHLHLLSWLRFRRALSEVEVDPHHSSWTKAGPPPREELPWLP